MIEVVKNGKTYRVKSEPNEITLTDFDKFVEIFEDKDRNDVDKYIEISKVFGLPNEVANSLGAISVIKLVNAFLKSRAKVEMKRTIEIDGDVFEAFEEGEQFELSASQLSKIANIYKKELDDQCARIMSIIFTGKLTEAKRRELFREHMTADVAMPYVYYLQTEIIDTINELNA